MSQIGIFVFSGTGNTQLAAAFLKQALESTGNQVTVEAMEDYTRKGLAPDLSAYDLVGFGHPVLGLGCTRVALDFARLLPDMKGKRGFVFQCCGDPHWINNNASRPLIKILKRKGLDIFHEAQYAMAVNFIFSWDDDLVLQLYKAAQAKSHGHAAELLAGIRRELPMPWILRGLCRLVFFLEDEIGARHFGLSLKAGPACNACGLCSKNCPTGNIQMTPDRVRFGSRCIFCMRCVYSCPARAIGSRLFGFTILKRYNGGFNIDTVLKNPQLKGEYLSENAKGYQRHIWRYIQSCQEQDNSVDH